MSVINTVVRRISSKCIQKPVPFHLVPYDEQYETRDFKRNVTSYPNLFRAELEELEILYSSIKKHNGKLKSSTEDKVSDKSDK